MRLTRLRRLGSTGNALVTPKGPTGERRCGRNAGRDGEEERRGEKLCYEFTIARHTILLPFSFSSSHFPLFSPYGTFHSPHRTYALFFTWLFISLFPPPSPLLPLPALLSSIYVPPVSPSACAPSTPLAPTASPLMVSASAVSISAFYLLSAVSVLFFTGLLSLLSFH